MGSKDRPVWQRNLAVLWLSCFMAGAGMSLVQPFLPLFVDTLGEFTRPELSFWSGAVYAVTFLTQAVVSPLWGRLADRFGRKPMLLRAGFSMAVIMFLSGFVTNVVQLVVLRAILGMLSGFISNAVALVASTTPKEKSGAVIGTLNTSHIAGLLLGPLVGGLMAAYISYRYVFLVTGVALFVAVVIVAVFVVEKFVPPAKGKLASTREVFAGIDRARLVVALFATTFILMITNTSINPILSLYVREVMDYSGNIEIASGLAAAAPGITAFIAAPFLGALGDRIGTEKILAFGLALSMVVFVPMALVTQVWQLVVLRLVLGIANASLMPSVQALLMRHTPNTVTSRVFSYNQSAQSAGMVIGPVVGASIGGLFDYRQVFYVTAAFAALNLVLALVNTRQRR
ncbi:MAG: MFS transporter [Coriobacteriales bacterium]|jgi:DHA1 family multidrug resistance protein-like MFS transporter|nr:MFS transporter [Coriobacteriales bacterium]